MVQFGLVFFPSQIEVVPFGKAIQQSVREFDPSMKTLGVGAVPGGSLYPWTWHDNDADLANFNVLHDNQLDRIEYTQLSREGMTTTRK